MAFQATVEKIDSTLKITLSGNVDEEAALPPPGAGPYKTVELHLEGVELINSMGIKNWLFWIRTIQALNTEIKFFKVPRCLVLQFNMVQGFLPAGAKVESFVVPMYCDKCECDYKLMASTATVPDPSALAKIDLVSVRKNFCSKSPCELELDCNEKYLQFLRKT